MARRLCCSVAVRLMVAATVPIIGAVFALRLLPLAAQPPQPCPVDTTLMGRTHLGEPICEDLRREPGALLHIGGALRIPKGAEPMYVPASSCYLNYTLDQLKASGSDLLGNALLSQPSKITLKRVMGLLPPLVYDEGYDAKDPAHGGRTYKGGVHTFVGSRGASVDACFDSIASDVNDMGYPSMNQFPGKYGGRSSAIFKDPLNRSATLEGLWGGHLPIISFSFAMLRSNATMDDGAEEVGSGAASGGWIEFTAVPKPDMKGSIEQGVMFRLLKLGASGQVLDAKYYDTYVYTSAGGTWGRAPAEGQNGTSTTASRFYSTVAEQVAYWQATWQSEGLMELELPHRPQDTDGAMLAQLAKHGLVRDMITRQQTFFPKYGVLPGVYGQPANNGFEDTFTATMTAALEMGAFQYATGVLDNWLTHYLHSECDNPRDNATCFARLSYRGPEMALHGHQLRIFSTFYHYTGDPTGLLLKHFEPIRGLVQILLARRKKALALPKDSVAFGMLTGNDEADLNGNTVSCSTTFDMQDRNPGDCVTELPYISITGMAYRGFAELGPVLSTIGSQAGRPDIVSLGNAMTTAAPPLLKDFQASLQRSAQRSDNLTCHPHIAGWGCDTPSHGHCNKGCGPIQRDGQYVYPTLDVFCNSRTYPEVMWSAALPASVASDIVQYTAQKNGFLTMPTRGATWCTFVQHGWGYGLIHFDMIDQFLVFAFSMAAHSYTRGTWTAAECSSGDRGSSSSGYAAPSQSLFPSLLRWMLVFEDINTRELWLGKAIPREWLSSGEKVVVERAPTRYGRISYTMRALPDSVKVNITLPKDWRSPQALLLRLRLPSGGRFGNITVGGISWSAFDQQMQTVSLGNATVEGLSDIVVERI